MACKNDPDWNTIIEPQSESNVDNRSTYPYMNLYASELHSLEMDDTPGNERIRLQHGNPNSSVSTFLEIHPDGTEVHKIYGDGYEIVTCNKKVLVKGSCTIAVDGNAAIEVKGNAWSKVKGNYSSVIEGNANIVSKKTLNITADKEIVLAADQITLKADQVNTLGDIQLQGDIGLNESTTIQGNLNVGGSVFAGCGLLTTGSLVVGPMAATYPNAALLASFVEMDVLTYISMKAVGAIGGVAGAAILFNAGADFTATAIGTAMIGAPAIEIIGAASTVIEAPSTTIVAPTVASITTPIFTVISPLCNVGTGVVNVKGIFNVTGMATALDFISMINPTPYSIHGHAPLALTPPIPI